MFEDSLQLHQKCECPNFGRFFDFMLLQLVDFGYRPIKGSKNVTKMFNEYPEQTNKNATKGFVPTRTYLIV